MSLPSAATSSRMVSISFGKLLQEFDVSERILLGLANLVVEFAGAIAQRADSALQGGGLFGPAGQQLVGQADRVQIVDKVAFEALVQAIEPDLRLVGGGFIEPTVDRRVLNRVDTGERAARFTGSTKAQPVTRRRNG